MKKDIMLTIIGTQYDGDQGEDRMEFVTEGKLYEKDGSTYLVYEESEFSGFPGCRTSLKVRDNTLRMKRFGSAGNYSAEIEFEKGKRFVSKYQTPYGLLDMEVLTERVENNMTPEGKGSVAIDYHISFEGMVEGRNTLRIEVN